MYLLDTNVIGEIARNPQGDVANRVAALPSDDYGINSIVACEIEYGLAKRGSSRLRQQIEPILEAIAVFELPSDIAAHYGQIRVELEKHGTPIGPNDLLIAAHGLASGLSVVTGNEKEFRRVQGLNVENWLTC